VSLGHGGNDNRNVQLDNWLAQRAETCPDRDALQAGDETLTYRELEGEAEATARRLAGRGVRAGSEVTISMPAGIEYAILVHALMKLGAVLHPLDPRLGDEELAAALGEVRPALEINGEGQVDGGEADYPLFGEIDLDAPHCRILTSGTSGSAKAVELSYGNHLWSAVGSAFNLGVDPADRWLCCLPLFHVSGLSILLRSVIYGTTVVIEDGFDADRVAEILSGRKVTLVSLVATQLSRLTEVGADIAGPRALLLGGGPMPGVLLADAIGRGAAVVQTYGLTEAASQVATLPPEDAERKLGSAGRPLLTTHVRIEGGQILVQGPTVSAGCFDADGWLRTGDLGWIDEEGFLYVTGRGSDLIVSGGENVMPAEIEAVLLAHPAVADAAIFGRPDPEWQEAVCALVVLGDDGATEEGLREHCAASLAPFKVPKQIEFVSGLPRTPSGKLLRNELEGAGR
jgi:O-succinylbenzoic acid--CoA ligase